MILCLQLICLPANIAKLKVQYTLRCEEADSESTTIKVFEYEQGKSYGLWTASKKLSFEHFKLYDTITLSADIMILEEIECNFGENSEDEIEAHWLKYIKEKREFEEISTAYVYDHKYYHLEQRMNVLTNQMNHIADGISALNSTMQSFVNGRNFQMSGEDKSSSEIRLWLQNTVGLGCYHDLFVEHGLEELSVLSSLRMNDLASIGIDKLGHRLKIMKCIALLAQQKHEDIT